MSEFGWRAWFCFYIAKWRHDDHFEVRPEYFVSFSLFIILGPWCIRLVYLKTRINKREKKNPMFFGDKGRSIIYKDIHQNVCIPSSITFDALHYFFRTSFLWNRHVIYVNFLSCFYGWGRLWKSTSTWSGFNTSYKDLSIICSWSWSMQWNSIGANEECTKMFLKVHITLWNSDFIKNSCSELFWMFESITTFSRNGKKPENQHQILLKPKFRI